MPWRTICPDPTKFRELTLDELLAEPVVRLLMARDGVGDDDIRRLADQAREKLARHSVQQVQCQRGRL
jgi:hypothetical protein